MKKLFLVFFLLLPLSCQSGAGLEKGKAAPDFNLSDLSGRKISLSDYKDKVVVLEFWATWCGPCRESIPEMNDLNKKIIGKNAVILGVNVDDDSNAAAEVADFAAKHGITYEVLLSDEKTNDSFGIRGIPATFVLDKQHRLAQRYIGAVPSSELLKEVEALL